MPGPDDDPEDVDPGLARARTDMAWTRTAISFVAAGAAIAKEDIAAGAIVLALGLVTWSIRRLFPRPADATTRQQRLALVTAAVTAVGLVLLIVVLAAKPRG
jgi:uncharacterized membrane protein YidH (DUF202 family)